MKKFIFITVIACGFFLSCNKEKDTCATNTTSIAGAYKITAVTYKASASSAEADYFNTLFPDACERDDVYTFQTNGTYQLKDAGTVCSPSGDDDGTWSVSGNSMIVDGDATVIESFDCKSLVIANSDINTNGDKLKLTLTKQ